MVEPSINSGTLNVTNSTLNNNTATNYGGAICIINGSLTVTNSTLNNNTANYGGAIWNEGLLTVTNSTLNNNTAHIWWSYSQCLWKFNSDQ